MEYKMNTTAIGIPLANALLKLGDLAIIVREGPEEYFGDHTMIILLLISFMPSVP